MNEMDPGSKRNTDQFASGPFRPHGRVEIWAEGNVVRLDAAGPFNEEAIIALGAAWRSLFAELPLCGPFADVVLLRRSILASQKVVDAFGLFLAANTQAGHAPSVVAWIVPPEIEGRSFMLPKFAEIYAAAGRPFAAFETEAEAEAWVRAKLQEAVASPREPNDGRPAGTADIDGLKHLP